jgi:ATP-dependent exoDNAse (exonuclease V) beta subunit
MKKGNATNSFIIRRLLFVGMTRAKFTLILSHSEIKTRNHENYFSEKSEFLIELSNSSSKDLEIIPLEKKFKELMKNKKKLLEMNLNDLEEIINQEEEDQVRDEMNESFNSVSNIQNKINFLFPPDVRFFIF